MTAYPIRFKLMTTYSASTDGMKIVLDYPETYTGSGDTLTVTLSDGNVEVSVELTVNVYVEVSDWEVTDVEIIDFKSGEKIDGEYQADHDKQLRYYAIAARESLDMDPQRAFVHHLSEDDPAKEMTEVDISDKHLKQTREHIEKQVESVISR